MNDPNTRALPPEQLAIRDKCFHPSGIFIEFKKEEVEQSIPERFEKIVRNFTDRIAVKIDGQDVTYAELNAMANRVARAITAENVSETKPVALLFAKGIPQVAAMLGVLKAGRFFVPLDPALPKDRTAATLEDSQAELLLTDAHNVSMARQAAPADCRVMEFESIDDRLSADDVKLKISPKAIAYLIYTSGSTGRPKGVIKSHVHSLRIVMLRTNADHISARDRIALLPAGTANSVTNTFLAVLNGGDLLPFDVKENGAGSLAAWLIRERISVCQIASPLFRKLCEALTGTERFPDLRFLRLRSEAVYKSDVDLYRKHFPSTCIFANGLSSSEAGTIRQYMIDHNTEITGNDVPLGYAMGDAEVLLLDDDGNAVGEGEIGEIVVRSRYLADGYWRRPDLDAAKFKPDPDGGEERLYLSGDLGLMLADGCLIHKGRKDLRVKIRGYGVEIEEVENFLRRHSSVREAVVVARQNQSGESRLIAYFTSANQTNPSVSELRSFLKEQLPDYMIPSAFVSLTAIPLTPNGKVDRLSLPVPENSRPELAVQFDEPRNKIEERLAQTWEAVLDIRQIGINDDFFDLGGHSLLIAQLIAQIERDFHVALPGRVLFEFPTIAGVASAIETKQRQEAKLREGSGGYPALVKLQTGNSQKTIFCFPFAGGFKDEYVHFIRMARLVGPDYSFYGLRARGADGVSQPYHRIEDMAADYVRNIRSAQPHGPYLIIGDCGGCSEAFETARQLRSQGEEIALLAILDDEARRPLGRYLWRRLTARSRYRIARISESRPWNYIKATTEFHLRELQRLDAGNRVRYLCGKISHAGSLISDLSRQAVSHSQPKIVNRGEPDPQPSRHMKRARRARYLARSRYRHPPYNGRVTLLVNEEWYEWHKQHDSDPTLGWAELATGGVEIYKIPGNHETYITENIQVVAEMLEKCLRHAEKRNLEGSPVSSDPSSSREPLCVSLS
jgi:amino acid adenylation domain-containing protein